MAVSSYILVFRFLVFTIIKTGFHYLALAVLELTLQPGLASTLQISIYLPLLGLIVLSFLETSNSGWS